MTPPGLHECHDCAQLQRVPALGPGALVACRRCHAVLRRTRRDPIGVPLALYCAALLLLLISCSMTMMSVSRIGLSHHANLASGPIGLTEHGIWPLAAVVLFTTIGAPLLKILLNIAVLTGVLLSRPTPRLRLLYGWLRFLRPWSMVEIYLLAVFVAYSRLGTLVHIDIGVAMYARVGNAIQAIDATKLIIVEPPGIDWSGVRKDPVTLDVPDKLVYSAHEYPGEISGQKVSAGPGLIQRMSEMWGWLVNENIAPVFIGEIGSSMKSEQSKAWAATIVPYLNGTSPDGLRIPAGGQGMSTDWWAWGYLVGQNPDGTLEGDWRTPRPEQEAVYSKLRQVRLPEQ